MTANVFDIRLFPRKTALLMWILVFVFGMALFAQEPSETPDGASGIPSGVSGIPNETPNGAETREPALDALPGLRERAVVMHVVSRIVEQNQKVVWDMESTKVTIPGRPVGLKLVGSDLVVAMQFTPFLRSSGRHTLVAQGQIWVNVPNEGISYHTTMQTIPLDFEEQVYFFPLGSMEGRDDSRIEIQLMISPLSERNPFVNTARDGDIHRGRDHDRRNASPP